MIGLCTDSNAQVPPDLARRYGVEVVPLTVTVDGVDHLEGVDLDADGFYARFAGGATPTVATAAPSPGRFAAAYRALADAGADEILSVHIGSAISATLNAARLAAAASPVPVRLVDTGTASFGIACCLWEAAEAIAAGAGLDDAAAAEGAQEAEAFPVVSLAGGSYQPVARVRSVDEAADAMAAVVLGSGDRLRVGISVADAAGAPVRQALESRLDGAHQVVDLVRYRVGPSVGVHTGPGTAGAMWYPTTATTAG